MIGDPGADPEHAAGITYPICPGDASGSPRKGWRTLAEESASGVRTEFDSAALDGGTDLFKCMLGLLQMVSVFLRNKV